jgi:uncharacterized protein (TIGR02117 family)
MNRNKRLIAAVLYLMVAACAPDAPLTPATTGPKSKTIYLVARGWHTDVGIPASSISGQLARLRAIFPNVGTLLIGFGERAYLLDRQHGSGDMLRALIPGPGELLVTALKDTPESSFEPNDVIMLRVSQESLDRLVSFLNASFEAGSGDTPRPEAEGPYPGSLFFRSGLTYSGTYTCNTWTAQALRTAGLPLRVNGVLLTGDVVRQVRPLAVPDS